MAPLSRALQRHGRDATTVVVGRCLTVLGSVVGLRLSTEYLSPEVFGRYKLTLAGISLITGILVRPFIQHAMRAYHDAAARGGLERFLKRSRRSFDGYAGGLGLASVAAGWLLIGDGRWPGAAALVLIAGVLALQALVEHERALSITAGRQGAAEGVGVGVSWLVPIAIAAAAQTRESLPVILAAHAGVLVVTLAAARQRGARGRDGDPHAPEAPADTSSASAASAWRFAWPLMVAGCLGWFAHESDRFVLGYFRGERAVGLYTAAYGLAAAPFSAAVGAIAQIMHPVVFGAAARSGRDDPPVVSRPLLAGVLLVGVGGVGIVWLAGDWIAYLMLAESYRDAAPQLLVWISLGYACFGVAMCFDLAAFGAKRTEFVMIACGVAAVTNVGLDLLLVPAHGATGAAVATAAALFAYLLCMAGLVMRGGREPVSPGQGPDAVAHARQRAFRRNGAARDES